MYTLSPHEVSDLGSTIKSQVITTRARSASPRRLSNEIVRKITTVTTVESDEERIIKKLKLDNRKLNNAYNVLLGKLTELEDELQHFKKIGNQLKKESIALQNNNRDLESTLHLERDRSVNLERESDEIRDNLERRNDDLQMEIEELKKKLDEKENDLFEKDVTIARLERESMESEMNATRAQKGKEALQEELARERRMHKQALRARDESIETQTTINFSSPQRQRPRTSTYVTTSPYRTPLITHNYSDT